MPSERSNLTETAREVNPHLKVTYAEMRKERVEEREELRTEFPDGTEGAEALRGMNPTLIGLANKITRGTEEVSFMGKNGTTEEFKLGNGEKHSITINNVKEASAEIRISSDPIDIELAIGESKRLDINKDGKDDVIVKLEKLENGEVSVALTILDAVSDGDKVDFRIHLAEVKSKILSDPNVDDRGKTIRSNFVRKLEASVLGLG